MSLQMGKLMGEQNLITAPCDASCDNLAVVANCSRQELGTQSYSELEASFLLNLDEEPEFLALDGA